MVRLIPKAPVVIDELNNIRNGKKKLKKKNDEFKDDIIFAVKQWIRIRGPRARKSQGAEFLVLQRLEKWLENQET